MTKSKVAHLRPACDDKRFNDVVCATWDGSTLGSADGRDWLRYNSLVESVVAATWTASIGTEQWIEQAIQLLDYGIDYGRRTHEAIRQALHDD